MGDRSEGGSSNKRIGKESSGSFICLSGTKHQIPMTLLGIFVQEVSTHINSELNTHTPLTSDTV